MKPEDKKSNKGLDTAKYTFGIRELFARGDEKPSLFVYDFVMIVFF